MILINIFLAAALNNLEAPEIKDVLPHNPSILVPVNFIAVIEKTNANLTYLWDFGDGSVKETTKSGFVKHTYSKKGIYNLKLKILNKNNESNKTIEINAIAPKDSIEEIITNDKKDLENLKTSIEKLPEWIREEIRKKIDIANMDSQISIQENKYDNAESDDEYTNILKDLLNIKIPYKVDISEIINAQEIFQNENQFDFEKLSELGAGDVPEAREDYFKAIDSWLKENSEISLESKIYSLYYSQNVPEPIISYFNLNLKTKEKINNLYFVINGNPEEIVFNEDVDKKDINGNAAGIIFSNLESNENKKIEFLYPEKIDVLNLPFYFSPGFEELNIDENYVICNNNDICEKETGETYKNCRNDCKPFTITISMLIFLFIGAFVIYILLQEWYKRYYENTLFQSRNYLFNLMSFINNSLNQGYRRSEIFGKLKQMRWKSEQLDYAWNKFHGKRTGMFEIPVFKWFENQRIKKELEKRSGNYIYRH